MAKMLRNTVTVKPDADGEELKRFVSIIKYSTMAITSYLDAIS